MFLWLHCLKLNLVAVIPQGYTSSGVFLLIEGGTYTLNFTAARDTCLSLNVTMATKAQMEWAIQHGLETCKFGWIAEMIAVIPRLKSDMMCGTGKTGVVPWNAPKHKKFAVFCFNSSGVFITVVQTQNLIFFTTLKPEIVTLQNKMNAPYFSIALENLEQHLSTSTVSSKFLTPSSRLKTPPTSPAAPALELTSTSPPSTPSPTAGSHKQLSFSSTSPLVQTMSPTGSSSSPLPLLSISNSSEDGFTFFTSTQTSGPSLSSESEPPKPNILMKYFPAGNAC
uniref:Link domain-containing protein n=1 Tax=Oryzias sinensis TaxID=183150 RepID=A0A8C8DXU1_9TELE